MKNYYFQKVEKCHSLMLYKVGFYIHHHGSGHIMRAITIVKKMSNVEVTFLGSNLEPYKSMIPPSVKCIDLPLDVAIETDINAIEDNHPSCFHYAPLNIKGIQERNNLLTNFFLEASPLLFIVDVSAEIALFARLCGIPTILIRQTGNRLDPAHTFAYESAEVLIAPYAESMSSGNEEVFRHKTYYSGGFSRYTGMPVLLNEVKGTIAVLVGSGGTSINQHFLNMLAAQCSEWAIHVLGDILFTDFTPAPNLILHGKIGDPIDLLASASIVIGNAGHNTVMEMADLNKRFICIPEIRPFDEQTEKAALLKVNNHATIILPNEFELTNWNDLVNNLEKEVPNWDGVINTNAVEEIVEQIYETGEKLFCREVLV
jgi:hypothetical protein